MIAKSKFVGYSRSSLQNVGIEGILMTISPLPLMLSLLNYNAELTIFIAILSFILLLSSGFLILRFTLIGKIFAALASIATLFFTTPYLVTNPFAAFLGAIISISIGFYLFDFKATIEYEKQKASTSQERSIQRVRYGIITILTLVLLRIIMSSVDTVNLSETYKLAVLDGALIISAFILQLIFLHSGFSHYKKETLLLWTIISLLSLFILSVLFYQNYNNLLYNSSLNILTRLASYTPVLITFLSLITLIVLPPPKAISEHYGHWWEMFLNHPARMMLTTFMGLCILGTILLSLSASASNEAISVIDAAFTSVSAVCVTGLIVLDTPNDFTVTGQFFILLLIQLGGLGIMSITTVGMHVMGRRLTLRQERLLTSITDTDHKDLINSLANILKFTFVTEIVGCVILTLLFYNTGEPIITALWRGGFTSISAFCNAGFALQTDNLIGYQSNPLILHTVAILIILGGIAPATNMLIPHWISGKSIPVAPYIALITTAILLISGTIFILVFDWNGVLAKLSIADKINNAWFQSVTLRTAGFNSVDIAQVTNPSFLVMICWMFIGGSPGGTAGGVKTTTIGILVMTFWANITNNKSVVILNRRIQSRVIYRAITIVASGVLTWIVTVLMLEITQQIPVKDIIFEVTSALGTVGLSTGATVQLDEIGKTIIMITMFVGRIGPITIFMLLSEERSDNSSRYQNAKISLT